MNVPIVSKISPVQYLFFFIYIFFIIGYLRVLEYHCLVPTTLFQQFQFFSWKSFFPIQHFPSTHTHTSCRGFELPCEISRISFAFPQLSTESVESSSCNFISNAGYTISKRQKKLFDEKASLLQEKRISLLIFRFCSSVAKIRPYNDSYIFFFFFLALLTKDFYQPRTPLFTDFLPNKFGLDVFHAFSKLINVKKKKTFFFRINTAEL